MMKNVLFMLIILLFSACSKNQTILEQKENKELELKKELESKNELIAVIKEISMLIANDNTDLLNSKYINNKIGAYEFFKDEDSKEIIFKHIKIIEELDDYVASFEPIEEEITFNCNSQNDSDYGWNKDGLFFFKKKDLKFFEKIKSLTNLQNIESSSYEVIVTNNIVFVLSKIENSWFIIAVDMVKTDCME